MSDLSEGKQPEIKAASDRPVPDVEGEAEPGSPGRQPLPPGRPSDFKHFADPQSQTPSTHIQPRRVPDTQLWLRRASSVSVTCLDSGLLSGSGCRVVMNVFFASLAFTEVCWAWSAICLGEGPGELKVGTPGCWGVGGGAGNDCSVDCRSRWWMNSGWLFPA